MFLPSMLMTPVLGAQQAGDGAQNGGFTGAVCADQGHDFPVVYLEGDALNGVNFAVVDV